MKFITELQLLGLSEKEAAVYKTLLMLGRASPPMLAERAMLPKSTVNEVLKSLRIKGYVRIFFVKKRKWYTPADPEVLRDALDAQVDALGRVLPELKAAYDSQAKTPTVAFFDGPQGLRNIFRHMVDEAKEIFSFNQNDPNFQTGGHWEQFDRRRIARKIPYRSICEDSPYARNRATQDTKFLRQTKIIANSLPFGSHVFLWTNKVAFVSFVDDFRVVVIEDPAAFATLHSLFEIFWREYSAV